MYVMEVGARQKWPSDSASLSQVPANRAYLLIPPQDSLHVFSPL